jgi:FAD/FMN-containing dehydrogenase
VILPTAPAYERARRVWNGAIDRRPAAIFRCGSPDEVAHALAYAREQGLAVSVRCGGHSVAGHGVLEGGVMIDVGRMREVTVDGPRLTVGGGALWSDVLERATPAGVATPGAYDPRVGVAGLTLGGGYGMLTRLAGMACDHLEGADLVTASGEKVRAEDDAELLWGLRGGGAHLGVVTALRLRAEPIPPLLFGIFAYTLVHLPSLVPFYLQLAAELADDTTAYLGIFPAHAVITSFHFGDPEKGKRIFRRLRRFGPAFHSAIAFRGYDALHVADEETFPADHHHAWRSRLCTRISDVAAFTEAARAAAAAGVYTCVEHLGGAMGRVAPDATAFPHRGARLGVAIAARWQPPDDGAAARAAAAAVEQTVVRDALGIYANYMGAGDEDPVAAYGTNLPRLRDLKQRLDPENRIRGNVGLGTADAGG